MSCFRKMGTRRRVRMLVLAPFPPIFGLLQSRFPRLICWRTRIRATWLAMVGTATGSRVSLRTNEPRCPVPLDSTRTDRLRPPACRTTASSKP
jgi:hypothetical protein